MRKNKPTQAGLAAEVSSLRNRIRSLEARLHEKEFLLATTMDHHPDRIYFKDPSGRFTYVNRALLDDVGAASVDEILGKTDADLFTSDFAAENAQLEDEIIRTGAALYDLEEKETWHSGDVTWVSSTKIPTRAPDGSINGIFGITRDITKRKQAQQALSESEERFRSIFTYSPIGIAVTNTAGAVQFWNAAMEKITGAPAEIALGRPLTDILKECARNGNRGDEIPFISLLSPSAGDHDLAEVAITEMRFSEAVASVRVFPLITGSGNHLACFLTDITHRKRIEKDLRNQIDEIHIYSLIAGTFVNLITQDEIIRYIAPILSGLSGSAYFYFFLLDPRTSTTDVVYSSGFETVLSEVVATLGFNPFLIKHPDEAVLKELSRVYEPNNLRQLPGGIYDLFMGQVSKADCERLKYMLDIARVYTIGITWQDTFRGGAAFAFPPGAEIHGQAMLESILSLTSNVLQRVFAEEQRQQTLADFYSVLENLGEAVAVLAADGAFLFANRAAGALFAFPHDHITEQNIATFLTARQRWSDIARIPLNGASQTTRLELPVRLPDGSLRTLSTSITPQTGGNPNEYALVCLFQDISLRKQAEDQLKAVNEALEARVLERTDQLHTINADLQRQIENNRAVEETLRRLESAVNQAAEGIAICDMQNCLQFVNPAWAKMHGYAVEEILGMDISVCHTREQYEKELEPVLKILFSTGTINSEIGHTHRDGTSFPTWTTISAIAAPGGKFSGYISVSQDITSRKVTERALKKSREELRKRNETLQVVNRELARATHAKDEFLANMSHELRTPLTAILGIAEALQEQYTDPLNPNQINLVKVIEASGRHLLELINDILDLSKIDAGMMELSADMINLESLSQTCLQFIRPLANKKQISVKRHIEEGLRAYRGDQRRIKQILVNLLNNAVKFTHPGGSVGLDITSIPEQGVIVFEVWDTGIGIAEKDIQRLFKPFTQLDSSLTRQHEGSGLGLALVYRLVDMQGGSLEIDSVPGKGSRFSVLLPIERDDGQAAADVQDEALTFNLPLAERQPLVLLIEDSEVNIHLITRFLQDHRLRVEHVFNSHEGILRARELLPDMVLMDLHMPGMDGSAAIRNLRKDPATAGIPIIALTALTLPGDRERALEAGADLYMSKPFSMHTLMSNINRILTDHWLDPKLGYDRE